MTDIQQEPETLLQMAEACETLTKLMLVIPGIDTVMWAKTLRQAHARIEAQVQAVDAPDQVKLKELADRIDHEKLWSWAGMDHYKMTPEQRDRMNAGVYLRRYADLLGSNHWRLFPPKPSLSYRAETLDEVIAMARKDAPGEQAGERLLTKDQCRQLLDTITRKPFKNWRTDAATKLLTDVLALVDTARAATKSVAK